MLRPLLGLFSFWAIGPTAPDRRAGVVIGQAALVGRVWGAPTLQMEINGFIRTEGAWMSPHCSIPSQLFRCGDNPRGGDECVDMIPTAKTEERPCHDHDVV